MRRHRRNAGKLETPATPRKAPGDVRVAAASGGVAVLASIGAVCIPCANPHVIWYPHDMAETLLALPFGLCILAAGLGLFIAIINLFPEQRYYKHRRPFAVKVLSSLCVAVIWLGIDVSTAGASPFLGRTSLRHYDRSTWCFALILGAYFASAIIFTVSGGKTNTRLKRFFFGQ